MILTMIYFAMGIIGAIAIGFIYFQYRSYTKIMDALPQQKSCWW